MARKEKETTTCKKDTGKTCKFVQIRIVADLSDFQRVIIINENPKRLLDAFRI
jgi:hypothetical protein